MLVYQRVPTYLTLPEGIAIARMEDREVRAGRRARSPSPKGDSKTPAFAKRLAATLQVPWEHGEITGKSHGKMEKLHEIAKIMTNDRESWPIWWMFL